MAEIDIHAMLLRAENRARDNMEKHAPTAGPGLRAALEESYATACAVRRNWEAIESKASPANLSGLQARRQHIAAGCTCPTPRGPESSDHQLMCPLAPRP